MPQLGQGLHCPETRRLAWATILFGLVLGCSGCGLGEYEKRIDEQARLLKQFDEETVFLGEPLNMPVYQTKENKVEPWLPLDVFLRPPKNISNDAKGYYEFQNLLLFRYPGSLPTPAPLGTLAPSSPAAPSFTNLFLAAAVVGKEKDKVKEGEMSAEEFFRNQVRGALVDFVRRELKQDLQLEPKPTMKKTIQPAGGRERWPAWECDTQDYTVDSLATHFSLYFVQHRFGNEQVALVYQVSTKEGGERQKAMETSLKTLGLGGEASRKRTEWNSRRR